MTVRLSLNFGRGRHLGPGFLAGDEQGLAAAVAPSSRPNQRNNFSARAHPDPVSSSSAPRQEKTAESKTQMAVAGRHPEQQSQQPKPEEVDELDDPKSHRIAELEDELHRLRESTKAALQYSWDENESLSRRSRAAEDRTAKLERKLEKSKGREEHWRSKCQGLWHRLMNESGGQIDFKLGDDAPPEDHSDEETPRNNPANRHTFLGGLRRTSMDMIRGGGGLGRRPDPQQRQAMEAIASQLRDSQRFAEEQSALVSRQAGQIDELQSKLSSRDAVITTLEQTAEAQGRALNALRHQLDGMRSDGSERESKMGEEIIELRKRVQEKKAVIKEQCRKYSEAQDYIEEVTNELQRVYDTHEQMEQEQKQTEEQQHGCSVQAQMEGPETRGSQAVKASR